MREYETYASGNVDICLLFFVGLLLNVGIELTYAGNKPRVPDITSNRNIRMTVNHGSIIYVNEEELQTYNSGQTLTLCVMLVSVVGAGLLKVFASNATNHSLH
jgi:hypothetical protein